MKVTKLDLILNAWISLLIGAVLSICLPIIVKGSVSFGEFLMGTVVSGVLGFLIVLFIPIIPWGFAFAAACGAKPRTLKHQLLTTIVLALCIGIFMSAFMNWLGMRGVPGYQKIFLGVWLHACAGERQGRVGRGLAAAELIETMRELLEEHCPCLK